jgi:hypothetical protein
MASDGWERPCSEGAIQVEPEIDVLRRTLLPGETVLDAELSIASQKIIYDILWKIYIINDIFGVTWSVPSLGLTRNDGYRSRD